MATIVFADGVDVIKGSRRGLTFDVSQAGNYVKKRPSPINSLTNNRMQLRWILKEANKFFWALTDGQKNAWTNLAAISGVTGPYEDNSVQAGCAMFFKLQVNNYIASDGFYANHPPHNVVTPPIWLTENRIDNNTIRVTFVASAQWVNKRIYLRQALPGPGVRRWSAADGYIAEYSELSPGTPHDFTTHFPHLAGWNGRYWLGCQRSCGCRSEETQIDISS